MKDSHPRAGLRAVLMAAVALLGELGGNSQTPPQQGTGILTGVIRDSQSRPVDGATVTLRPVNVARALVAKTGADGLFGFSELKEGSYSIHAEKNGAGDAVAGPFKVVANKNTTLDLTLTIQKAAFFDEPSFTVAGVTDSTYLGGHGSDAGMRSTENLARATAKLGKPELSSSTALLEEPLRNVVTHKPDNVEANVKLGKFLIADGRAREALPYLEHAAKLDASQAEIHQLLGDANEQLGNSLGAVREYQRAVELDANELNLFDWGAELLVHRAAEPAIEVFTRGNRLFPQSGRMLLGLAAAYYARGDYSQAARHFFEACDVNPLDPGPYLFMARVQSPEITHQEGYTTRLEQFVRIQPDSAWAKYYYAANIWSVQTDPAEADALKVMTLLEEAIHLDPKLGVAYLQLGILYSDRKNYAAAISAFQNAVRVSPELEQAHYRLARAYERVGRDEEGRKELGLFQELSKKSAAKATRERGELQQFIFALRNPTTEAPAHSKTQPH